MGQNDCLKTTKWFNLNSPDEIRGIKRIAPDEIRGIKRIAPDEIREIKREYVLQPAVAELNLLLKNYLRRG